MSKSKDPTREIARLALNGTSFEVETLENIIRYAFEQLCFRRTDNEIANFLAELGED